MTRILTTVSGTAETIGGNDVGQRRDEAVRGALVLVVEDEPSLQELFAMVLRSAGHRVITDDDGWEALSHFPRKIGLIDLIVSDLQLPTIGAIEMYERMKHFGMPPKILVCSGLLEAETIARLEAAGIFDYIPKPFQVAELLEKVGQMLGSEIAPTQ